MPTDEEFDSYAPGSNLKEDFDGTITDRSGFEKSDQGENWSMHFVIEADDGEEVETYAGLGSDWMSYDGGRSVEHPKGERRKFNSRVGYSEWIVFALGGVKDDDRSVDVKPLPPDSGIGATEILRAADRAHSGRGAQFAEPWYGLKFHFDVFKRKGQTRKVTKDDQGNEVIEWPEVERERMLPVRFLGMADQQMTLQPATSVVTSPQTDATENATAGPVTSTSVTGAATSQPTAPTGGALGHPGLNDLAAPDKVKVIQLAKTCAFGDFVDQTMVLTTTDGKSMLDVGSVMDALADEAFWNALRG